MASAAAPASSLSSGGRDAQAQLPHIVIFPFMAKSHTIPLTHLAHLLRRRQLANVTFLTTPGNAAFVRAALPGADDGVAVVELPFPHNDITVPGFPRGAECVEALDSLSSFPAFVEAASLLQPRFEEALTALRPPASAIVADAFLHWAHPSAAALGVRTLAFFGANVFAHVIRDVLLRDNPAAALRGGAVVFAVPEFPDVQFSLADIPPPFNEPDLMVMASIRKMDDKIGRAIAGSDALIVNTFDAMERRYIEHWNRHLGPRAWPVGPLCLARPVTPVSGHGGGAAPTWMRWLDEKAAAGRAVLYVALGTMAAVPDAQLREVAGGLEQSGIDFLWAVRPVDADLGTGFEDRVRGRGVVVREWVDQFTILRHGGVKGFISHCGWNSVTESISTSVPLAVWPMGAEQLVNAKLVVDELRIGIRVPAKHGVISALVESEEIARVAKELMIGEKGAQAARKMAALGATAREAMDEGGSSWRAVEEMIAGLRQPAAGIAIHNESV